MISKWMALSAAMLLSVPAVAADSIIAEGASLNLVADDFTFTEGPAADTDGNVFFTDQPNNKIWKYSVDGGLSLFMEKSGRANGLYFDGEGNLLACADNKGELWRIDAQGNVSVLLDNFDGRRLNGPNDLWVAPNGGIYFTDPFYLRDYWHRDKKEIEIEGVYYLAPGARHATRVSADLVKPNGLIGSADGKTLYVADIGANKTYVYAIGDDGSLSDKTLFVNMGSDGMTLDSEGNLYLTGKGVTVFDRQGKKIEHIPVPEDWTANVTFGGAAHQTLFITAMDSVYTLKMRVAGR